MPAPQYTSTLRELVALKQRLELAAVALELRHPDPAEARRHIKHVIDAEYRLRRLYQELEPWPADAQFE